MVRRAVTESLRFCNRTPLSSCRWAMPVTGWDSLGTVNSVTGRLRFPLGGSICSEAASLNSRSPGACETCSGAVGSAEPGLQWAFGSWTGGTLGLLRPVERKKCGNLRRNSHFLRRTGLQRIGFSRHDSQSDRVFSGMWSRGPVSLPLGERRGLGRPPAQHYAPGSMGAAPASGSCHFGDWARHA